MIQIRRGTRTRSANHGGWTHFTHFHFRILRCEVYGFRRLRGIMKTGSSRWALDFPRIHTVTWNHHLCLLEGSLEAQRQHGNGFVTPRCVPEK